MSYSTTSNESGRTRAALAGDGAVTRLLSTEEVAMALSLPRSTLDYWRVVGGGPPWIKIGRRVKYPMDGLIDWLERQPSFR
jgi:hypothetical protein